MNVKLRIQLNDKLYLRDPEETKLGQNIASHFIIN